MPRELKDKVRAALVALAKTDVPLMQSLKRARLVLRSFRNSFGRAVKVEKPEGEKPKRKPKKKRTEVKDEELDEEEEEEEDEDPPPPPKKTKKPKK